MCLRPPKKVKSEVRSRRSRATTAKECTNLKSVINEQSCSIVKTKMITNILASFLFLCYLFIRKRVILLLISFKLITFVRLAVFFFFNKTVDKMKKRTPVSVTMVTCS